MKDLRDMSAMSLKERGKREKLQNRVEKITAKNFPTLARDINIQIQEVY